MIELLYLTAQKLELLLIALIQSWVINREKTELKTVIDNIVEAKMDYFKRK
jgi:hypothetical protein